MKETPLWLKTQIEGRLKSTKRRLNRISKNRRKDILRKIPGIKKIKRSKRQPDDVSVVSSTRSCISTARNVARALKRGIPKRNPKHYEAFKDRPNLTNILYFSPLQSIAAPLTQPSSSDRTRKRQIKKKRETKQNRKEKLKTFNRPTVN